MKITLKTILALIALTMSVLSFGQCKCKLLLEQTKLTGKCQDQLFSGIEITLDASYDALDSLSLFQMLPRDGFLVVREEYKLPARFVITDRAGFHQILLKPLAQPRVGWYTFDSLRIGDREIDFFIDKDPNVPFSPEDLQILAQARKLLQDPDQWNDQDDRRCEDDQENGKYSFFCALQTASTQVVGEYNHRNAVMQLIRRLIEENYPNLEYEHRFKDFNNRPNTSLEDIHRLLDEAEGIVQRQLEQEP